MHKWHYMNAGLRIISDLELPEWEIFLAQGQQGQPDVVIRLEVSIPETVLALEGREYISATEYRFCVPETGSYRVTNGNDIAVVPAPGAGQRELRLFLLGSAWGALCYQRGVFAVHAGAVCVGQHAVLFCAKQGKGKSTMTACLAFKGHALVSDDLCCIDMQPPQPLVYPSTQRLRLWRDALTAFNRDVATLEQDHFRLDKYLLPWKEEPVITPLRLRGIYLLEWGEYGLTRLTGRNALQSFVSAATYRGALLERMGLAGPYWQRCLDLVQNVPVWQLTRPRDLTSLDRIAELLEHHWTSNPAQL